MNGWASKPEAIKAVAKAEGPGSGITAISFLMHSCTKIKPGSEMTGIPASDISAIFFPSFISAINSGARCLELYL